MGVGGGDHDVLGLESERRVGRELGGDLLDPAVVALGAVVPEVALAVEDRHDEVVAVTVAHGERADPQSQLVVPGGDRVHRADAEAAHVDAVGVFRPRRAGGREVIAHLIGSSSSWARPFSLSVVHFSLERSHVPL